VQEMKNNGAIRRALNIHQCKKRIPVGFILKIELFFHEKKIT
jgi:hypothetical protein